MGSKPTDAEPSLIASSFQWPVPDDEIREALDAAYRDGSWGQYHGPHSEGLIADLQQQFSVEHIMLCSSGTIGIELALRGCGVEADDEVILAGYDFPGNFRAIEAIGARPVLVDVDPTTWCLDANCLSELRGEKIKAVIVSHLHGGLADMPRIVALARERGWRVVEDACQQPGAVLEGRPVGSWGDVGVLSFGGSKLLTAGRGGAVLTNHAQHHQRMKVYSDRGNQAFPLSELQAAVLRPQLKKLSHRNQLRRERVVEICEATSKLDQWLRPIFWKTDAQPVFYKFAWSFVPAETKPEMREELLAKLAAKKLPFGVGFRGFVSRSERRCRKAGPLPHSAQLSQSTLLLHHPILLAQRNAALQITHWLDDVIQQMVS